MRDALFQIQTFGIYAKVHKMDKGNLIKEKIEFYSELFKTQEGLFDFFIGSAIWGFIIVKYDTKVYDFFYGMFSSIGINWLRIYLTYLAFGIFWIPISILISYILIETFNYIKKIRR